MSNAQSTPSTDPDDILPILDEELGRLPQRSGPRSWLVS